MRNFKISLLLLSLMVCVWGDIHVCAEKNGFSYDVDTWGFPNSVFAFGNRYEILPEDTEIINEMLTNTEKYELQDAISGEWQGVCYGMSVSALLAYYHIIDINDYDIKAGSVREVLPNMSLISMINYYQQLQCIGSTRQEIAWSTYYETSDDRLTRLIELVKENKPSLLCFNGHFMDREKIYGHAVVAYGYEEGEWEWNDQSYNARLLVYDPNTREFYDKSCLYLDTKHGNWRIPAYMLNSEDNDKITMVSANVEWLNNCGLVNGTHYQTNKQNFAMLKSKMIEGEYACTKTKYNGVYWNDTDEQADIKTFQYAFGDSLNYSDLDFLTPDLDSGYIFEVQQEQYLDVTMDYCGILMMASGNGQSLRFSPEGVFRMQSSGQPYQMQIVCDKDYYGSMYSYKFEGNAANIQVAATEKGYLLQSDHFENVKVCAEGDSCSDFLSFSTDAECVLISESTDHLLKASVDLDDNGTYETILEESHLLGDVNQDLIVNAKDATEILKAAAHIGTGVDTGLTTIQEKSADVNSDGILNSADATWILRYSAAVGSGSFQGSLNEYVAR